MAITTALPFRPAYMEGTGTFPVQHAVVKSGETWVLGAPVTVNAGEIDEIDTDDVTLVLGVAGAPDASAYGYQLADSPTVITGRANTVPVFVANPDVVFFGQLANGTTAFVTPTAAHVDDVGFGIAKQADGHWTVDSSDTTNKVVKIVKFDTLTGNGYGVFFKFLRSTTAP